MKKKKQTTGGGEGEKEGEWRRWTKRKIENRCGGGGRKIQKNINDIRMDVRRRRTRRETFVKSKSNNNCGGEKKNEEEEGKKKYFRKILKN